MDLLLKVAIKFINSGAVYKCVLCALAKAKLDPCTVMNHGYLVVLTQYKLVLFKLCCGYESCGKINCWRRIINMKLKN